MDAARGAIAASLPWLDRAPNALESEPRPLPVELSGGGFA